MQQRVSLSSIFWLFFKLGAFTFGGGYAMVALMDRELVHKKKWFDETTFLNILSAAQAIPGVMGVNTAAFAGSFLRGWKGLFAATFGSILPSFIIISLLALVFDSLQQLPQMHYLFISVRAATAMIILFAGVKLGYKTLKHPLSWVLASAALVLLILVKVNPLWILLGGLLAGLLAAALGPKEASKLPPPKDDSTQDDIP